MTEFTARRSPSERVWRFEARSSGIGRRRPSKVVTNPSALACAIVRAMNCLHVREAREVGVDVGLRLLAGNLEVLGEAERRDPVDDPEVDHLRDVALGTRQRRRILAEHLGRRCRVDVVPPLERLPQHRLARDVREDAQLDLAVVGRHEPAALLGDERRPDLAAELGADRDRLQVGVGRRQPAGCGNGLVERRVEAAVGRREQRRQRAEVRVEQLRVLAPFLDHGDDLVLAADAPQHAAVGRVAGLALAAGRQPELLEQDAGHLLGRAEHELLARKLRARAPRAPRRGRRAAP